jgi:uncharacterized membrane protein
VGRPGACPLERVRRAGARHPRRPRPVLSPGRRLRAASPWLLALLLVGAGANHLWHPEPYDDLIPAFLGAPRPWALGSGVAEIGCGLLLAVPRTRRVGGWATLVLFVVVFPGNITSAVHADDALARWVTYLRLPLQLPLVLWAAQVVRDAPSPDRDRVIPPSARQT